MLLPHGTVFAIVDGEKFELYRNSGMESEPLLTALATPDLEATNYSAAARDHDKISRFQSGAPKDRLDNMEEAAHATAVAQWLNSQVLSREIDKLVVVADPKSLGEMRRHYHKELSSVLVAEVPKNLAGRPPQEIVKVLHG